VLRSSFASIAVIAAGLVFVASAPSEASEVSEVTIGAAEPAQTRIAHDFESSATLVSEVTVFGGAEAEPGQLAGIEPPLVASTVSEVTIQPPLQVAEQRESRRSGASLSAGSASPTGGSGMCSQ
jgi:hypothetical protein